MMEIKLFKNWWVMLINGIIFTVLGIASIFSPFTAILTVALYIGFAAGFSGFSLLVFKNEQKPVGWLCPVGRIACSTGLLHDPRLAVHADPGSLPDRCHPIGHRHRKHRHRIRRQTPQKANNDVTGSHSAHFCTIIA